MGAVMDQGRTGIINQALLYMGQDTILDPVGESKNAKLCAAVYDETLAEVLSGHPWSFAVMAARLQQLEEKPRDIRFAYAYQLPEDCGRILSVEAIQLQSLWGENAASNTQPVAEYMVQGKSLVSNHQGLQIVYVRTNVRPHEMTPQFKNYFSAMIANRLHFKINGSTQGEQAMYKRAVSLRIEAMHTDSEQTDTMPVNRPNLFVNARLF